MRLENADQIADAMTRLKGSSSVALYEAICNRMRAEDRGAPGAISYWQNIEHVLISRVWNYSEPTVVPPSTPPPARR